MVTGIWKSHILRFTSWRVHGVLLAVFFVALSGVGLAAALPADEADEQDAALRPVRFAMSLDGTWNFVRDPDDLGLVQDWATSIARSGAPPPSSGEVQGMEVPRAIESKQVVGAYDGVVWYWRSVVLPLPFGRRTVLSFDRVNHACTVWVNGREVGSHMGGYDSFELDVSEAVDAGRRVSIVLRVVDPGVVPVDGLTLAIVPHAKESWYENFGGILGPVSIAGHADVKGRIQRVFPDPETGDVRVELLLMAPDDGRSRHVEVELRARPLALEAALPGEGDHRPPALTMVRRRVHVREGATRVTMSLTVPGHQAWSPERPWRYLMGLQVHGDERASGADDERSFGFRSVRLDADGFFLNGERRTLKGVLYQPHYIGRGGLYPPAEELHAEVLQILDAGFNLVRAHVRPAPRAFLDACDRHGLLVLEEPAIGWVDASPRLEEWLDHEVEWMVKRDHHHPSIVIWGVFNELSGDAHLLGETVVAKLVALDHSRPVLEDSGGFFRSRYVPAGTLELTSMLDEHIYPPCPIPFEERERMRTLSHDSGPALVSEFGYGSLMDAEANVAEFERRGLLSVERDVFVAMRKRTRAAVASGETWHQDAWLEEAPEVQSGMAVDMLELLRSNQHLVGSIYTQWQAVSTESSAGLLDPWGGERPALSAMNKALAPLQLNVFPARPSSDLDGLLRVDVVVVNDTGAPLEGGVVLNAEGAVRDADGSAGRGFDRQVFPPGVTTLTEEAFRMTEPGEVAFRAYFVDGAGEVIVTSRAVPQVVVPPPPDAWNLPGAGGAPAAPIALVLPEGDGQLAGFAAREGFAVRDLVSSDASVPVVLLEQPKRLGETLTTEEQLRLWRFVYEGGAVILLAEELPQDHIGRLAGSLRGIWLLPHVPVRFGVGFASGNFMGRCHVAIEANAPRRPGEPLPFAFDMPGAGRAQDQVPATAHARLLRSHEASFAPVAMIVGVVPSRTRSAAITLNHFRSRAGMLVSSMPFGRGKIMFVGMPLHEPIAGEPDPLRDRTLSGLIEFAAFEVRNSTPSESATARPLPLTAAQLDQYASHMEHLVRLSGVGDRYSFITSGRMAPESVPLESATLRDRALVALFREVDGAWEHLEAAFDGVWTEGSARFVEREEALLGRLKRALQSAVPEKRVIAAAAVQEWGHGVVAGIHGDPAEAQRRLEAAEALLPEESDD